MTFTTKQFTVDEIGFIQIALSKVLAAAARGELDLNLLASEELASRGLDSHGKWVGFERASQIHQAKADIPSEPLIEQIAQKHLCIDTLKTRNGDSLDFHEVSVWGLKAALQAAFEAGSNAARKISGVAA